MQQQPQQQQSQMQSQGMQFSQQGQQMFQNEMHPNMNLQHGMGGQPGPGQSSMMQSGGQNFQLNQQQQQQFQQQQQQQQFVQQNQAQVIKLYHAKSKQLPCYSQLFLLWKFRSRANRVESHIILSNNLCNRE